MEQEKHDRRTDRRNTWIVCSQLFVLLEAHSQLHGQDILVLGSQIKYRVAANGTNKAWQTDRQTIVCSVVILLEAHSQLHGQDILVLCSQIKDRVAGNGTRKSRGVCKTLQYAPGGNKVEKAIFSFKVKVKVTRSLTLVSFERASLVEYACQIWSLYLLRFKSYSEG